MMLDLSANLIGDKEVEYLANVLKINTVRSGLTGSNLHVLLLFLVDTNGFVS